MKNKFKGFTLIELLAVIVILAIIALIASPIVIGVIEDSRMEAAERGAEAYIESVKNYSITNIFDNENAKLDGEYTVAAGKLNGSGVTNKAMDISGALPTTGKLVYDDNTLTSGYLVINGYKVTIENGKVTKSEKDNSVNDTTPPVITYKSLTNLNAMQIYFDVKDNESEVIDITVVYGNSTSYGYEGDPISGGYELKWSANNLSGIIYYKITATNAAGLTSEYTGSHSSNFASGGSND